MPKGTKSGTLLDADTGLKICSKCVTAKSAGEFCRDKMRRDILTPWCKACIKAAREFYLIDPENRAKLYRAVRRWSGTDRGREKVRAAGRAWAKTPRGRANQRRKRQAAIARAPEKIAARKKAEYAIRRGTLKRQPCEVCASTENIHAHHDDYSRPLDVRWLCFWCHQGEHARKSA